MTELRKALPGDLDAVVDMVDEIAAWLKARGVRQWLGSFPRETVAQEIAAGEVYVASDAEGIFGSLILASSGDDGFWAPDEGAYYLHRLAVTRRRTGQGLGAVLLKAAEEEARKLGARSLRLDCDSANDVLTGFYRRLGYVERGVREYVPWKMTFMLFEKDLEIFLP